MDFDDFLALAVGLIFAYWPFVAALALGLLLPAIVVMLSGVSTKWPDHLKLTAIFASIVIGSTLAIAFSGRTLVSDADLAEHPNLLATLSVGYSNFWFSRIAHLIMLSVSIAEIFTWAIRKRHMGKSQFLLWAAVMIYYLMTEVVSGVLGNMRSFEIGMFYAPIVFTAVALLASSDIQKTYISLRWILLVPLVGSLVAMVVAPHLVLETGYKGFIPGISFRLAGLTEHANSLGVIAAIALLLEFSKFVCKKPNVVFSLISFANLILAQSKTAWVIVIIGIVMINFNTFWKGDLQTRRQGNSLAIVTGVLVLAAFAMLVLFLKADSVVDLVASDRSGLTTFTGRTKIWEITWNEFLNNPLSGYGPSIWDLQFRFQHGMMFVGQAHSQYMQTIGQAGLLGAVALAFYIYLLVSRSYQGWNETNGFSFLMVLVLLIRGFSESPMRMSGILDFDGFTHLLAFLTVAALALPARDKRTELSLT